MQSTPPLPKETTVTPRVQVRSAGIDSPNATLSWVERVARQTLFADADKVTFAALRVARTRDGQHRCYTQLFGRELQHAAGYAGHSDPMQAAAQSVARALRALKTSDRFNPWTSPHPGCQRGEDDKD